ncbi:MAG: hypothetical protein PUD15_05225 [Prevotella sp.]|uniref:hypothetical protein n=1 Tax=Prevotella sp. AGR2160 TaxID=1280674 RepID=UPI000411AB18|nr:hypothetical protein [Prevotella sp. AGR2160]MDD5861947.1 hypothetical protein [Prevotella sp.]
MKKMLMMAAVIGMVFAFAGCKQSSKKATPVISQTEQTQKNDNDSTVYGVCGDGTAMHTLELITDAGDTLNYMIDDEEDQSPVVGGLFSGDRMAVIGHKEGGDLVATKIINLTTLTGKWMSLDKNFEILEGGQVKSYAKAENNPWTTWKILNGKLLLNKDTFDIDNLGADSLYLENKNGIFTFKRQK